MKKNCIIFFFLIFIIVPLEFTLLINTAFSQESSQILLNKGWNFISFPKDPPDKRVGEALKSILTNIHSIWGYDNETKKWQVYRPNAQSSTYEILKTIESGKGYWIYMNNSSALDINNWNAGKTKITLYPGWNLIGWGGNDGKSIKEAFSTISGKWDIIWGWENGTWKGTCSNPFVMLDVEPLLVFNKSKAYWIKLKDTLNSINYNFFPPVIKVTPESIDFGEQYIGVQITYHGLILTNSGLSPFTIKSIEITGDNASEFSYTSNCSTVAINKQCDILVHFSPSSEDSKSANLVISSDEPGLETIIVHLSGKGKKAPPPEIISHTPEKGAEEVPVSVSINITFKDNMDSTTINNNTIIVKANNQNISGSVSYDAKTKTATFKPTSPLSKGTTYTVIVSNECETIFGGKMTSPFSWTFTTVESSSGLWEGTFTSLLLNKTFKVYGVITEDGEARFFSEDGTQYYGNIPVTGKNITVSLTAFAPFGYTFPNGSTYGTIWLIGTVKTKNFITGTYNGVGDYGAFNLQYSTLYEKDSSISYLTGNWSYTDQYGNSQYMTVNSNGTFTGYSGSCTFSGTIAIIDPLYNAYRFKNVYINNCGVLNGTYNGLGALSESKEGNILIIGISNPYVSLIMLFKR